MAEAGNPTRRADAARNRDQLLAVATRVFASADAEPSLRAIAREAGVGIGTLYRHFPTRESLVDAVYRSQVMGLTTGAHQLLEQGPPAVAMRRWMDLFGDWVATKNGMLETLLAMIEAGEIAHGQTRDELLAAITTLLEAGQAVGEIRRDVTAEDVAASLIGIFTVAPKPQQEALGGRLLDLLMDGLRPVGGLRRVGEEAVDEDGNHGAGVDFGGDGDVVGESEGG
ncbi:TetR/AcrR family transcriptional regulator [Nocardia yunnanensis]|uniref:TetR/AcrR family transcriptional regulator n=1 Tax=Nocardia yunnanensis TaxID=2382165 RepID=A0A386ZHG5_9NOCA|nr:TetR/AcrR family transcriptional regulator [Nocardia yunnanensis]